MMQMHHPAPMRLVLRHDCLATGCGDSDCLICRYNPYRRCKANLKAKYLVGKHLEAKCGANLLVEIRPLGDEEMGVLVEGTKLEVSVLNGEKYSELCTNNNNLYSLDHLRRDCIVENKRCFINPDQEGKASLSELAFKTSSEALLSGKAPTVRLLISAVNARGEHLPNVTYVVSEPFVVATRRVKSAIKPDIPSIQDSISKLIKIGQATIDKLVDLKAAAREDGIELDIPDELNNVHKIGQFQLLAKHTETNLDVKVQVMKLLKLSPEMWDEVCKHAMAAVVPDFRNRIWSSPTGLALLYECHYGATATESPIALLKDGDVTSIARMDPSTFTLIEPLKQEALAAWFLPNHPGWAVYP